MCTRTSVDNSGPMFKDYSSAKLLAGEPEETNPFDQEDVADQSGDDDAADDGEQLHEDEDERLDNDDHELLDKAQTDASGTAASNDIDLEAMLQDSFKLQAFRPGKSYCAVPYASTQPYHVSPHLSTKDNASA